MEIGVFGHPPFVFHFPRAVHYAVDHYYQMLVYLRMTSSGSEFNQMRS